MKHTLKLQMQQSLGSALSGYSTCREESLRQVSKRKGVLLTTYGMVLHNSAALKLQQHGRSEDSERRWDFIILDEVVL